MLKDTKCEMKVLTFSRYIVRTDARGIRRARSKIEATYIHGCDWMLLLGAKPVNELLMVTHE